MKQVDLDQIPLNSIVKVMNVAHQLLDASDEGNKEAIQALIKLDNFVKEVNEDPIEEARQSLLINLRLNAYDKEQYKDYSLMDLIANVDTIFDGKMETFKDEICSKLSDIENDVSNLGYDVRQK